MRITYSFVLVFSIGIIGAFVSVVMIAGASPGQQTWGDVDCKGDAPNEVATRDSQAILRHVLEQNPLSQGGDCPDVGQTVSVDGLERMWGDVDCKGDAPNEVATRDSQALLRYVLEQPALSQAVGCPGIGQTVDVGGGGGTPPPTSLPTNSPSPTPIPTLPPPSALFLRAQDGTYLGEYTCNTFSPESIFNQFGPYGGDFGIDSIWNEFGLYGSQFQLYSPFNQFSFSSPAITDGVLIYGYLTVNDFVLSGIHPQAAVNDCFLFGSLNWQYWTDEIAEAT